MAYLHILDDGLLADLALPAVFSQVLQEQPVFLRKVLAYNLRQLTEIGSHVDERQTCHIRHEEIGDQDARDATDGSDDEGPSA